MDEPSKFADKQVHFNGFKVFDKGGQITMHLMLDGKNVITLQATENVAKTFGHTIQETVHPEFPPGSLLHHYTPEQDAEELMLAKASSLRVEDE
jgi:hypothetical protein